MQTFTLTVLAIYSRNPSAAAGRINHILGVPPAMIRHERQFLAECGFLEKDESSNWHVTDAGAKVLADFDREKARRSALFFKEASFTAATALNVSPNELSRFSMLDKGMTNDSYVFYCRGKKYIYRRAGNGSEMLVDRYREYANYLALEGRGISDVVIYHNPYNGTKITEFLENSSSINPFDTHHLEQCLKALRSLHNSGIASPHDFDFLKTIDYYENLCHNMEAELFKDYSRRKGRIAALLEKVNRLNVEKCFCHIDFVPGNCLMLEDGSMVLIDWEYSGRQDPVVDVAMFCISAAFDKRQSDRLLKMYLKREPTKEETARFYTYIATAGLMWSLWSVYKTANGEVFEGYTERTYSLAKKYAKLAKDVFSEIENPI